MRTRTAALVAAVAAVLIVVPVNPAPALELARLAVADFGYDQGWRHTRHPRTVADVTGDGLGDLVGFGEAGVFVSVAQGDGTFGPATFVLAEFGYDQHWKLNPGPVPRPDHHPRMLVDVTGDSRADIVGFGDAGVYVSRAAGDGGFAWPDFATAEFGPYSPAGRGGWQNVHKRFVAEVTGDRWPDIVGVRDHRVWVAAGTGDGGFFSAITALVSSDFGDDELILHQDLRPFLADVNADDRADLVMIDERRIFVALSSASQTVPFERPYVAADFGYDMMRGIRVVDVTGDRRAEILGAFGGLTSRGPWFFAGVHVSSIAAEPNGHYGTPRHGGADFFFPDTGHSNAPRDNTWAVADMNGDGYADLVGETTFYDCSEGCANTYVAYSRGDGSFTDPVVVINDFGHGAGWLDGGPNVRLIANVTRDGLADIVGFGAGGVYTGIFQPDLVQETARLAAARTAGGFLEMYGLNDAGQVFGSRHTGPGGTWSNWSQQDGTMRALAAEANADERLELFGVDAAGQVWRKRQLSPGGSWSTWGLLDGWLASVATARNGDGRLALFGVNAAGDVWYREQTTPGGVLSGWTPLDGTMRFVAAGTNADGRMELFAVGEFGGTFHRWQTSPGGGWSQWVEIPGMWLNRLAVARGGGGRLELFGTDDRGRVWHGRQATAGGAAWTDLSPFDGTGAAVGEVRAVAAEADRDGHINLYALNSAGKRFVRIQLHPGSADWSGWYEITNGAMTAVPRAVPDVRGMSLPEASDSLRTAGYFVVGEVRYVVDQTCNSIGVVTFQSLAAGSYAEVGSSTRLSIGTAPSYPYQCP